MHSSAGTWLTGAAAGAGGNAGNDLHPAGVHVGAHVGLQDDAPIGRTGRRLPDGGSKGVAAPQPLGQGRGVGRRGHDKRGCEESHAGQQGFGLGESCGFGVVIGGTIIQRLFADLAPGFRLVPEKHLAPQGQERDTGMRAIGAFAADAHGQASCGDGGLSLGEGGVGHRAKARSFGGEGAKTVGVDLGPDEGDAKSEKGRRQRRLLAVHRAKRGAGRQGHAAFRVVAWLVHARPGRYLAAIRPPSSAKRCSQPLSKRARTPS